MLKSAILVILQIIAVNTDWLTDYDTAAKKAREENKLILLYFSGSDWCSHCIKTKKEIFENAEFLHYATTHLVLLNADFPKKRKNQLEEKQKQKNEALKKKYNPAGNVPVIVLLNAEGKEIKRWEGRPKDVVEFLNQIRQSGK